MNSSQEHEPTGPNSVAIRLCEKVDMLVARVQQAEQKAAACEDMERQASDYAKWLKVKLGRAERDRDEALEGLRSLSNNLTEVHKDPRYIAVWTHYKLHGGNYQGPFYDTALQRAADIIAKHAGKIAAMLAFLVLTGCATPNVPTCTCTCTSYEDHWSVTK